MDEGFLGSIMIWTQNRIPRGWMLCDGKMLQIAQNQALYALLGIQYGGDGRTTFALPDLRGRTVVGAGVYNNQISVAYKSGDKGGSETITINNTQMPSHTHTLMGNKNSAANPASVPTNNLLGIPGSGTSSINLYAQPNNSSIITPLAPESISQSGTGAAHTNMQPYMALNYIICFQGLFPIRQ